MVLATGYDFRLGTVEAATAEGAIEPDLFMLLVALQRGQGMSHQPEVETTIESINLEVWRKRLKFEEDTALLVLNTVCSRKLIRSIEDCEHHGWWHIRNVKDNLEQSLFSSPDFFTDRTKQEGFSEMVGALVLAERMHDIVEQHLISEGFADSKQFHGELAALYLLLIAPKLTQQFGYDPKEIQAAAYMSYFHSDPELISPNQTLPPVAKMIKDLTDGIAAKHKGGKHIPLDILDFFPVSDPEQPFITREFLERRLNEVKDQEPLDAAEMDTLVYWALRFAMADKIESLYPPKDANYRTLKTKVNREFYIGLTKQNALEYLQISLDETTAKIARSPSDVLRDYADRITRVMHEVEAGELTPELELRVHAILGEGPSAPSDFTRIAFELLRNYLSFDLTSFEAQVIGGSLEQRARHLKKLARNMNGIVNNPTVRKALEQHNIHKTLNREDLLRITQLINLILVQIQERYQIEDGSMVVERTDRPVIAFEDAVGEVQRDLLLLMPDHGLRH